MIKRVAGILLMLLLIICVAALLIVIAKEERPDTALNILLTLFSIGIGVLISHFYTEESFHNKEKEKITHYARAAFRLTQSIDRVILMFINFNKSKLDSYKTSGLDVAKDMISIIHSFNEYLLVLKSLSLSANENWQEMLPEKEIAEVEKKVIDTLSLSRNVKLVTEEFKIDKEL